VTRTYLFVPPEEDAQVKALGARRDTESMCWYIDTDADPSRFSKWMAESENDPEFTITSDDAYVASTIVPCSTCHIDIEVICIFCESGTVSSEPLTQFTVSDLSAMDDGLKRQLELWPDFYLVGDQGYYANHCPQCHAPQDDMDLHSEPDHPFFNIPRAAPGAIELTPLEGTIQLSGSESFEI
jgi:hypothetical protein